MRFCRYEESKRISQWMRVHQSSAKDQECLRLAQWLYRNKATEQGGHGRLLPDPANIVFKEDVPKKSFTKG